MTKWYDFKLPSHIVARPNDSMHYSATTITGKHRNKSEFPNAACFHAHMAHLAKYEFECRPPAGAKKSLLPENYYYQWVNHCVANGLIPLDSHPWAEKELNYIRISGKYESKHRIYTSLCCYRWADALAPLCYTVVKLLEIKPELNFYQALHYGMAKYVTLVGHSFCNIGAASMNLYMQGANKGVRLDLAYGLAVKLFFQKDADGKSPADQANQHQSTQVAISAYAAGLGLNCMVKKIENILEDKWIDFYSVFSFDKKKLKEYYEKNK